MRFFQPVKTTMRKNFKLLERGTFPMRVYPDLTLPARSDYRSAGYDFYSPIDITIAPYSTATIWTDIKASMLPDEYLSIHIRSSIGIKAGLSITNSTGIIDSSYFSNPENDGNICIDLRNNTSEPYTIKEGDRFAQGVFQKYLTTINDSVLNAERSGGIGSSGS